MKLFTSKYQKGLLYYTTDYSDWYTIPANGGFSFSFNNSESMLKFNYL